MIITIIWLVNLLMQLASLLIIIHVFISYFLSPYHPVRVSLSKIIEPALRPIRRLLPPVGMFDLSPLVLLILVQLSGKIIVTLLSYLSM